MDSYLIKKIYMESILSVNYNILSTLLDVQNYPK
jgi:hypothetical protein